jgi:hypothetical protein
MKVHPVEAKKQYLLRQIEQLESYIAEYQSQSGCVYWLTIFSDKTYIGDLRKELNKLRDELDSFDP